MVVKESSLCCCFEISLALSGDVTREMTHINFTELASNFLVTQQTLLSRATYRRN